MEDFADEELFFLFVALFDSGSKSDPSFRSLSSKSPLRSSSSSLPISDFRLSSSESPIAAAAATLDGCTPALANRLLANDSPDGALLTLGPTLCDDFDDREEVVLVLGWEEVDE